jgi:hypothetical protein
VEVAVRIKWVHFEKYLVHNNDDSKPNFVPLEK